MRFNPPPLAWEERATALSRLYFRPQYFGLEYVDAQQPALYVSNHTIYGMLDSPLLYEKLYKDKGIVLRSLGDHFHFDVPVWQLRKQVMDALESELDMLRGIRAKDHDAGFLRTLLTRHR